MPNLPIAQFLTARLAAWNPSFELRQGTGFEALFFEPLQLLVQPLRDETNDIITGSSFLRILQTDDPDGFNSFAVDALASNIFVTRRTGAFSVGTMRAYYNEPVDREFPANGCVASSNSGLLYSNPAPFLITASQMSEQIENGLYYFDIVLQSQDTGTTTKLDADELVTLLNDSDVVTVTNKARFEGGLDAETNTEFIARAQNSIGVRDLVAEKGFQATLFDQFKATLLDIQPIGMGDPEMMRDIVFNTHIGGRVDGYVRTSQILRSSADFVGILVDTTRQTQTLTGLNLSGTSPTSLGNPNIDRSNGKVPVVTDGGSTTYVEGTHYSINDANGTITRIVGATITSPAIPTTGQVLDGTHFKDTTANVFLNVQVGDVLTVISGPNAGDYRITAVAGNTLTVSGVSGNFPSTGTGITYTVTRTGIANGQLIDVTYWYNPLSIDIGNQVLLSDGTRGIRPGRTGWTITELPVLRITSIEEIDPITKEPTGTVLNADGGFGLGGFGEGPFGVGSGGDYFVVVNSPAEWFSMFEDGYIVLAPGLQGLSFRVNYDYVPAIADYHAFVRSDEQRTLNGDILIKHFLPAYVSTDIHYTVSSSDASVPDNSAVSAAVNAKVNKIIHGLKLDRTLIEQVIIRTTDPADRYDVEIQSFTLTATIYNTDGTITVLQDDNVLQVIAESPFPKFTTAPLTPRITCWFADAITLTRDS